MPIFETMLVLLVIAALLLQASRRLKLPYPSMLALAGGAVAALPGTPVIEIEPHLALALFVAPALFDSAFDTAPRELRRNWLPLLSLVVIAVLLTTAVVAWLGWRMAGMPIAAAITLGAIVAPPDAVAAAAVLQRFQLPRRTLSILNGESLLNDAVALLLFGAAVQAAVEPDASFRDDLPMLLLAVPGGALFGIAMARFFIRIGPSFAGTLSSTIVQFVATFGTWVLADRLHLSAIIAVVAYAMTIAKYIPAQVGARDRVHSYAVWAAVVFVLNVLAFLLMGLQARGILTALSGSALHEALGFAGLVLAAVVATRVVWVLVYGALVRAFRGRLESGDVPVPGVRIGLVVGWAGMRGLVTMAAAFALPTGFPKRDLIVLSAFGVVLGTLVVQGLTIGPLIRLLRIEPDRSLDREISTTRSALIDAALAEIGDAKGGYADALRVEMEAARAQAGDAEHPQAQTEHDRLRQRAIDAQRKLLNELRDSAKIDDDVYHRLEEELDWSELSAASADDLRIQSV